MDEIECCIVEWSSIAILVVKWVSIAGALDQIISSRIRSLWYGRRGELVEWECMKNTWSLMMRSRTVASYHSGSSFPLISIAVKHHHLAASIRRTPCQSVNHSPMMDEYTPESSSQPLCICTNSAWKDEDVQCACTALLFSAVHILPNWVRI